MSHIVLRKAGQVAQSVLSATDMLGYWDVRGWSATDPRSRRGLASEIFPRMSACHYNCMVVVTASLMSLHGDNTTPIINDSVA